MSKREHSSEEEPRADRPEAGAGAAAETADALAEMERERDEYVARWQRATADYQNLKRRTASDVENAVRRSLEGLLGGLLLVVDHLELALASPAGSDDARNLARGVELTRDQLLHALRQEGVEPMPDAGEFDPACHEAVATVESDEVAPGTVMDVVRRGYTWRGQVLRFAHVRVARAPQGVSGEAAPDEV